jgi:hypothetical protein
MGIAFDTETMEFKFYKSTGVSDPCQDVVQGAGAGGGLIAGQLKGDMEDFFGWSRERTEYYGPFSKTSIETASGKEGISASAGGKGLGFGYTSMETYTAPLF